MRPFEENSLGSASDEGKVLKSNSISNFVAKILSRTFDSVPLPEHFPDNLDGVTFVLLDDSLILDAILLSVIKRKGLSGIEHASVPVENREANVIYRTHFRDEETITTLAKNSPNHRFITFNTIHGVGPIKSTRNYSINIFDSLSLLIWKSSLVVVCGEPRDLKSHLQHPDRRVSRAFKVDFYGNLKIIRGTPFQPFRTQVDTVLSGEEFKEEISKLARDKGVSEAQMEKICRKGLIEVAANPVRLVYLVLGRVAKLIIWHLFSNVKVEGLQSFILSSRTQPTVLVPLHRSHLDYILLGSILFKSRLNTPLVAAGINLNFWPVGFFLRRVGAFFVKRTGGSDPVHALVLRRYVTYLLKRGHLLEFFIEGGRSRTGRMRSPKLGLLKAIVGAHQRGLRKDVSFVPVSISYEQVIEDKALAHENKGGKKIEENVKTLVSARTALGKSYGEVIVRFGEPISLSEFSSRPNKARGTLVTNLAQELTDRMRAGTNPTLTSLISTSLLIAPRYALSAGDLEQSVKNLSFLASTYRAIDPRIGEPSTTLQAIQSDSKGVLGSIVNSGLLNKESFSGRELYILPESRRISADFYRNATSHLYIPFSFMSLSELVSGHIDPIVIKKIHSIFEGDFLLPAEDEFLATISKLIGELIKSGTVIEENGNQRFRDRSPGLFLAPLMLSSLELYLWILYQLNEVSSSWSDDSVPRIPYEDFVARILGQQTIATEAGLVSRTETFSRASIESSIEALAARGIISAAPGRRGPRFIRIIGEITPDRTFLFDLTERVIDALSAATRASRSYLRDDKPTKIPSD